MPVTNNLKPQVDLPVWEWTRFAPVSTNLLANLTTAADGSSRYLFYYESTNNSIWKYDTQADSWYQLSNSNIAANSFVALKYVKNQGYRGNILSIPSSTQLQIPSVNQNLTGYQIKIISGTGAGQIRTITNTAAEVTHDQGVATGVNVSTALNNITDSTKRYKNNQWVGYGLRIVFGTGNNQFREILYNDPTSLTVWDSNYEGRNFLTTAWSNNTPYANPATTAGAQSNYEIVSQVITVNSPWTVTPDTTSKFMIMSGGIWLMTSGTNFLWYYYDILSDRWVQKLSPSGTSLFPNNVGSDSAIIPTNDIIGNFFTASFTTGTSQSIDTASLTPGDWIGSVVRILSGSGSGQERRIISNTSSSLVLSSKWDTMPQAGSSIYSVTAENAIYFTGNQGAKLVKYYPEPSLWSQSNILDDGIVLNLAAIRTDKRQSHGISTATRATTGITGINSTPTVAGSGYAVGDILTVTGGGGSGGRVFVESVSATGAVLSISLYTAGTGYTTGVGTGRATSGGTGSGCTIEITTTGTIGVITTNIPHDFKIGDTFTFAGATEAAWNTSYTIIGIQSTTIFEVIITATANAAVNYPLSITLLVDVTKNWIPGEHCGKVLGFQANGLTGNLTFRKIIGNSTNTISFISGVSSGNGSSRYFIAELEAFGDDKQYLADVGLNYGYPTSVTANSITDASKNWTVQAASNVWNGYKIQLTDNSGSYAENIIANNTSSSLSLGRTVAVGSGTNTIAYSDLQGSSSAWTGLGTAIFNTSGNGVVWNGSRFVAVGTSTLVNTIAFSNDGVTWNGLGQTIHTTAGNGVAWNGIRFITVGSGTNTIAHSNDASTAATFTGLGTGIFSTQGNAVAWNGTRWVAVGQGTNTIAHCIDTGSAVTFVGLGTSIFSTAGRGVCWAGSQFVAVGNGTNNYATSSDGVTWTGGGAGPFSTQGNAVAWNGTITVAVGQGTNTIAYSTNSGSTWTGIGTSIFSTAGTSITWNGTYWIAGGSGTNTTAFSTDGINWTGNGSSIITTQVNGATSTTPFQSVVPSIGLTPTVNTRYKIQDSYGSATGGGTTTISDVSKRWKQNQWAGKRVLITTGTGNIQETSILSNTSNTLTTNTITSPDTTSTYTIIGRSTPGAAGTNIQWNWGSTDTANKGRLLILNKGNNISTWDIFDLRTNRFLPFLFVEGARENLTTGTMYTYDGGDRIYYQINATGRINYYDIKKNRIEAFSTIPYGMSTATIGNRMEYITTADSLEYLYIMRHSSNEMWRLLIYY